MSKSSSRNTLGSRLRASWNYLTGKNKSLLTDSDRLAIQRSVEMQYSRMRSASNSYDAAGTGRLRSGWPTSRQVPYYEQRQTIFRAIARSRDLYRSHQLYRRTIKAITDLAIGPGIVPVPRITNENGDQQKIINEELAREWLRYSTKSGWDATKKSRFIGPGQRLAFKTLLTSGNVLANRVKSKKSRFPFAWQLFEVDRLDQSTDIFQRTYSNSELVKQTVHGINLDENGQPVSYWLSGIESPIEADNIIHAYFQERPEMYIGEPWGIAGIDDAQFMKDLEDDYAVKMEATARILGNLAAQFEISTGDKDDDGNLKLDSGAFFKSDDGIQEVKFPDNIQETFEPYMKMKKNDLVASFGIAYLTATFDMEGVNFAAANMASLNEWHTVLTLRDDFVDMFCTPVWEDFVSQCILSGKTSVTPSTYLKDPWRYNQVEWIGQERLSIDPLKYTRTEIENLKAGRKNLTEHLKASGKSLDTHVAERAAEKKAFEEAGLRYPFEEQEAPVERQEEPVEDSAEGQEQSTGESEE